MHCSSQQGKELLFQWKTSLNKQTPGVGAKGSSEMGVWRGEDGAKRPALPEPGLPGGLLYHFHPNDTVLLKGRNSIRNSQL